MAKKIKVVSGNSITIELPKRFRSMSKTGYYATYYTRLTMGDGTTVQILAMRRPTKAQKAQHAAKVAARNVGY